MIKVSNLTKRFGEFVAVENVSFSVGDGETLALLGPNGSGKSTILKCIAGLAIPSSGEVIVGETGSAANEANRRLLSYLPQRIDFH